MQESPDSLLQSSRHAHRCVAGSTAFTLIEVLLVVAVLAIIGGIGVAVVNNISEGTRVSKLENDVAVINSAVQVFRVSGGALPATPTVNNVLAELKKSATAASGAKVAGFRGGTIDPRLTAEFQTTAEANTSQARALWDPTRAQFVIATTGSVGVKRFVLSDAQGEVDPGTAARGTNNPLATTDEWVWEYDDTAATTPTGPTLPTTGAGTGITPPTAPGTTVLSAPTFSPPAGNLLYFRFPIPRHRFAKQPARRRPHRQTTRRALRRRAHLRRGRRFLTAYYSQSIDPTRYTDSGDVSATYSASPTSWKSRSTQPPELHDLRAGWAELFYQNGAALPAAIPEKATAEIAPANLNDIHAAYQSASRFRVVWTTDGSDPLTSATSQSSGGFAGGQIVDLPLANWTASGLTIRAAVQALDTTYFESSEVATKTITISKSTLIPPLIDPQSSARTADLPVNIYLLLPGSLPTILPNFLHDKRHGSASPAAIPPAGRSLPTCSRRAQPTALASSKRGPIRRPTSQNGSTRATWATAIYTNGAGGTGAVVADANINGIYIGSLIITSTKNFNLNSGAIIKAGNLFVRGTPDVNTSNGGVIEGRQFLSDGSEVIPAPTPAKSSTSTATPIRQTTRSASIPARRSKARSTAA